MERKRHMISCITAALLSLTLLCGTAAAQTADATPAPASSDHPPLYITQKNQIQRSGETLQQKLQSAMDASCELIDDTQTIINGERLLRLIELNKDGVLFEKQGVAVSLPMSFLKSLAVDKSGLFSVMITKWESSFTLCLFAHGSELTALPETLVRLPIKTPPDGSTVLLRGGKKDETVIAQWDPRTGLLTATITSTGTYEVLYVSESGTMEPAFLAALNESVHRETTAMDGAVPILLAVVVPGCVGGTWLWRGKRGR